MNNLYVALDIDGDGGRDFFTSEAFVGFPEKHFIVRDIGPALVPGIPMSVTASRGQFDDRVRVSWQYVWGATSYEVWRSLSVDSPGAQMGTTTGTTFDDTTATSTSLFYYSVRAFNQAGKSSHSGPVTGWVLGLPFAFDAITLPEGEVDVAYNGDLEISGGVPPYTVDVVKGSLPLGLALESGGVITGVPTVARSGSFTVQVTDSASTSVTKKFKIKVFKALGISTSGLKAGTVGKKYSASLKASGGKKPYSWSVTSGSLPEGLVLDGTTGKITGMPTASGSSEVTVQATDPLGGEAEKTFALSIS
jgi:hypothetical protein